MSDFFNEASPADTDNVSAGASVIRSFKQQANTLLSQLFTATGAVAAFAVKVSQLTADDGKWISGDQIRKSASVDADRAITSDHLKDGSVVARTIGAASVTPAAVAHAAFAYQTATWEKDAVTDTYVVDSEMLPPVSALADGAVYRVKADVANDAAPFLKLGASAPAKAIVSPDGEALSAGEIAANQCFAVVYRATQDDFQMQSATAQAVNSAASAFCVVSGSAEVKQDVTLSSGSSVFNTSSALDGAFDTGRVVAIYRAISTSTNHAVNDITTLVAGSPLYLRKVSTTSFSLHSNKADAVAGTNALTFTFSAPTTRTLSVRTVPVLDGFNVDGVVHAAGSSASGVDVTYRERPRPGAFTLVFSSALSSTVHALSGCASVATVYYAASGDDAPRYPQPLTLFADASLSSTALQTSVVFVAGGSESATSSGYGTGLDPVRGSIVVHAL